MNQVSSFVVQTSKRIGVASQNRINFSSEVGHPPMTLKNYMFYGVLHIFTIQTSKIPHQIHPTYVMLEATARPLRNYVELQLWLLVIFSTRNPSSKQSVEKYFKHFFLPTTGSFLSTTVVLIRMLASSVINKSAGDTRDR